MIAMPSDASSAETAGSGMDHHFLARFKPGLHKNIEPGCGEHFRQCRGLNGREPLWYGQNAALIDRSQFRVAAPGQQRADLVANTVARCTFARRNDFSRAFESHDRGRTGWWWIESTTLHQVCPVDRRCRYLDQDFVALQHRLVKIIPFEAIASNLYSFHRASPSEDDRP